MPNSHCFWRNFNSFTAILCSSYHSTFLYGASSERRAAARALAWYIMYITQVAIGSTSTCAPSRSKNSNMWKLPSPSVVWAQNSPMILTTGLTRRRSTTMVQFFAHRREGLLKRIAVKLLAYLGQRVDPNLPLL